jgi:hypothetical protein
MPTPSNGGAICISYNCESSKGTINFRLKNVAFFHGSQFFDYKVLDTIKLHVEADRNFSINYVHINYKLMLQTQLYGNVGVFCARPN